MTDSDRSHSHPRSTAQIGGHPIHPMLIPFPIVCFIGAFLTDIVYNSNNDQGWATASFWLLGVGLVTAGDEDGGKEQAGNRASIHGLVLVRTPRVEMRGAHAD